MGSQSRGPPNATGVEGEAHSEIATGPSFSARLANANPRRPRLLERLMLSSYVQPQEWDRPWANMVAPNLEVGW